MDAGFGRTRADSFASECKDDDEDDDFSPPQPPRLFSDILHTGDQLGTKEDSVVPVAIQTFSLVPLNPEKVEIPRNDPGLTVISADYQKKEIVEEGADSFTSDTADEEKDDIISPSHGNLNNPADAECAEEIYMEAPCASPDVENTDDTGNDITIPDPPSDAENIPGDDSRPMEAVYDQASERDYYPISMYRRIKKPRNI